MKAEKPNRRFTKRMMITNLLCGWGLIFVMAYTGQLDMVITPILTYMTTIVGFYVGIGHMDLRELSRGSRSQAHTDAVEVG